jgi:hypothetical protein
MVAETAMGASLDVGVFAPLELMRAKDVQGVIQQLREAIRDLGCNRLDGRGDETTRQGGSWEEELGREELPIL